MRLRQLLLALCLALCAAGVARAVQPDEMLKDPALEARAREISQGLRCLVCRNEDIDESNAALAHDLRVLVRKRLVAGDTDRQVVQYIVDRYGEFVLLRPRMNGANLILWFSGPAMLLLGLILAGLYLRRRRARPVPEATRLSAEEEARLARALSDD